MMEASNLRHIEVLSAEDPYIGPEDESKVAVPPAQREPVQEPQVAEAVDGSLAGRLRAVGEQLHRKRTRDFDIPDTPLVLRARSFRDRKAFSKGVKTESFVVRVTDSIYFRDDDTGELIPIPSWGPQLADMLGIPAESSAQLVERVLDNPVRLESFAADLINWMAGRLAEDEQQLGE